VNAERAVFRRPEAGAHPEDGRNECVGEYRIRGALFYLSAFAEYDQCVGIAGRQFEVVEGRDGGVAPFHKRFYMLDKLELMVYVEVSCGLVEKKDASALNQGLRQQYPLLFSTAER